MTTSGFEIERKYLLSAVPAVPSSAVALQIEQGYLPLSTSDADADDGSAHSIAEGRIRRTIMPDQTIICTHTIKRGSGLVREEIERKISLEAFEYNWPRTKDRRIAKTRHRVAEGSLFWEIDVFHGLDVVLAEIELPDEHTAVTVPDWLQPFVVRDVTEEPAFRNSELARQAGIA